MSLPSQVSNLAYSSSTGNITWDQNPSGDDVKGYAVLISSTSWPDIKFYSLVGDSSSPYVSVYAFPGVCHNVFYSGNSGNSIFLGVPWYVYVFAMNASGMSLPASVLVTAV